MSYMHWRRQIALSESMALRALLRMHGRLPGCRTTQEEYGEFIQARNAKRSRDYRRRKKAA